MSDLQIGAAVFLLIVIVLAAIYRSKIEVVFEMLGLKFSAKAKNHPSRGAEGARAGDRSVTARDATGSAIVTGDHNIVQQAKNE